MDVRPVPFGFMHEDEVRGMIQNYNSALSDFVKQVDDLTQVNQSLEAKYRTESSRSRLLQEQVSDMKLKLEQMQIEEQHLKTMNTVLDTAVHVTTNGSVWNEFREKLLRLFDSMSTRGEIEQALAQAENSFLALEKQNEVLKCENAQLERELINRRQEESKAVRCAKCRRQFIPLNNTDVACHFHSGKVKYYSCKGCGEDQYFTCCNRCERCSPGCKVGRHVPI